MELLDDYSGAFEPNFHLGRLSRHALGRLGREYMLFAHFLDRGLMPLVGRRFTPAAMTEVACDEWMGASPIYNPRCRALLGIEGDGVPAILKAFQVDVGFPHQYMDVGYEAADEKRGYFWLKRCGALLDVTAISRGNEAAIVQLCHHMEDPTFPATVTAVNRRARISPEHRPPLAAGHTGPHCRWRVEIGDTPDAFRETPITAALRASGAAGFAFAPPAPEPRDGMTDYSGPLRPDFALEDLAQPVLATLCREFALDAHLLTRAAVLSLRERFGGGGAVDLPREQWAAIAPVTTPRIRRRLRIDGDDAASILKTLQVDPALPHEYVRFGAQLVDDRTGRFWIEACAALAPGEPEAWLALLEDAERPGLERVVAAVQPRARMRPLDPGAIDAGPARLAWEIRVEPDAEPLPESPLANLVRASNVSRFAYRGD